MFDFDADISRKITKFALIGYAFLFFLSPAQPLLCSTLMGLLAIAPILLGPNPLRILGLLAFAVAGYLFWPEYEASKKIPARTEVRQAMARAEVLKAAVARYVVDHRHLPADQTLDVKLRGDDKADYELLPGGIIRVQMKFAPLTGLSLRWVPALSGAVVEVPAATAPLAMAAPAAPASPVPATEAVGSSGAGSVAGDGGMAQAALPRPPGPAPKLAWSCVSDDIAQPYLPANCRNSENLRKAAAIKK